MESTSHVQIQVYDLVGREVANLLNGTKEEGIQKVQFNASTLASGRYIVRIQIINADGKTRILTKNLTLIK